MDILSPDGAVLTEPGQVERALAEMWKQAGQQAGGIKDETATRICVANLIVVGRVEQWDDLIEALGELSPVYPTRTIVLLADPRETGSGVRASVTALCHVPQPGNPQVCCDQIVLRCGFDQCEDHGRTILPLLESDVPVMVWWTLDPAECESHFITMRGLATRLILDAGLAGFRYMSASSGCAIRELGWYRIWRWRELVAGMFDECGPDVLKQISRVQIEVGDQTPDVMGSAVWLLAFLAGQLGWEPVPSKAGAQYKFASGGVEVDASIVQTTGNGLISITVMSGNNAFEAKRVGDELRISVHNEHVCQVPRNVHLPRRLRSEALAAALAGRQVDRSFERAQPIASWIAKGI